MSLTSGDLPTPRLSARAARPPIVLTSHPAASRHDRIQWGAADPATRRPVIASVTDAAYRNAIGTHSGAYSLYRALAGAAGQLDPSPVRPSRTHAPPRRSAPSRPGTGRKRSSRSTLGAT